MPLFTDIFDVKDKTNNGTAAADPAPAVLTGTEDADLDFTTHNYSATLVINGSSTQTITFTTLFANIAALLTSLNTQTTGPATWTDTAGTLILTTDDEGPDKTLLFTPAGSNHVDADLFVSGVSSGSAETFGALRIYPPSPEVGKGTAFLPQRVLCQNQDTTDSVAVGGHDVEYESAPHIAPGGNFEVRLEAGEVLYAVADTGDTVPLAIIVTRV